MQTIQPSLTKVNNFVEGADISMKITDYAKRDKPVSQSIELSPTIGHNSYKIKTSKNNSTFN